MENDEVGHMVCIVAATDADGDKLWYYIIGKLPLTGTYSNWLSYVDIVFIYKF